MVSRAASSLRPRSGSTPREVEGLSPVVCYVYLLRCSDNSFYVGSTLDLKGRVKAHNQGRGAAYTFRRRPVRLVYSEAFQSEAEPVARERQVKGWSRGKKEALVAGDLQRLKRLSASIRK
ncbi:MAG: GIY-YIG nuclease family protein [Nitrospirae bacterium]|nr:MAG: GIY-YIG nuclease family protein [Nitrospirota bacterium]